jgi:hypothetical protein
MEGVLPERNHAVAVYDNGTDSHAVTAIIAVVSVAKKMLCQRIRNISDRGIILIRQNDDDDMLIRITCLESCKSGVPAFVINLATRRSFNKPACAIVARWNAVDAIWGASRGIGGRWLRCAGYLFIRQSDGSGLTLLQFEALPHSSMFVLASWPALLFGCWFVPKRTYGGGNDEQDRNPRINLHLQILSQHRKSTIACG